MMTDRSIIKVNHLVAGYDGNTIIDDVSFDIRQGEIFVILGGSGSGKSTLLRHIIGLDTPRSGTVWVDHTDITNCSERQFFEYLKKIGVLFQGSGLIGSMTLYENISLPIYEYTSLPKEAVDKMVSLKLKLVDLEGTENQLPSELSGGMKKRAGLARAMALSPKILFLDEPSAGLDPITSAEIDQLILQINKNIKTTLVIVTHELESIFRISDRIIMLDKQTKGIIAEGNPKDLKNNSPLPVVRQFFNGGVKPETAEEGT